jgi:hypothetical protein
VSSAPFFFQVFVAALKQVPVNLAEHEAVAFDARRLDSLQILLERVQVHPVAACITLHILASQGIHA